MSVVANYLITKDSRVSLDYHRPEGERAPETIASLSYVPEEGIWVSMRCYEEKPRAIYHNPNDPIYTDSCMEAFIDCFPELHKGYLNIEMNVNGASFCSFGTNRYCRSYVVDMGIPHPEVTAERGEEAGRPYWQVRCLLGVKLWEALYGRPFNLNPGHVMRGNFYKCADHAAKPHWSSWAPVPRLDFHDPDSFGLMIIGDYAMKTYINK